MKVYFLILSLIICSSAYSQVTGILTSTDKQPIRYANIVLNNTTTGCVSDSTGHFTLKSANIGDSLHIYHLNIGKHAVIVDSKNMNIQFELNNKMLNQITVSNDSAFKLFDKVYHNTYNKLRHKYINKAYWKGIDIINKDTVFETYIDLDVKQVKLFKLGKGAITYMYKINEYRKINNITKDLIIPFQTTIEPFANIAIPKNFKEINICWIKNNKNTISLFFRPKKSIFTNNLKVSILKKNMCINYIASYGDFKNTDKEINKPKSNIKIKDRSLFVKYEYKKNFAYLSKFILAKSFDFTPKHGETKNRIQISKYYTYGDINKNNTLRKDGDFIFGLTYKIKELKSNGTPFNCDSVDNVSYDFEKLRKY